MFTSIRARLAIAPVVGMVAIAAAAVVQGKLQAQAEEAEQRRPVLLREGETIRGTLGRMEAEEGRYVFALLDGQHRFPILENLALERVQRALDESVTPLVWSVTGTLTEYNGRNYLLLQSAILARRE